MKEQISVRSYRRKVNNKYVFVRRSSRQEDKKVKVLSLRPDNKSDKESSKKNLPIQLKLKRIAQVSGALAITGGASALGYTKFLRVRYRRNLGKSVNKAVTLSKTIPIEYIAEKNLKYENINIAVSGALKHEAKDITSETLTRSLRKKLKGEVIGIDTTEYNTLRNKSTPTNTAKLLQEMYGVEIDHVKRGYNPTAIATAATAMAYMNKYPNKNVVLYGHSAGAFITNEAMHLIEQTGLYSNRFKQVTFGGSYYGIFKPHKNSLNLINAEDLQTISLRGNPTSKVVNKPDNFLLGKEIVTRARNNKGIGYKHLISDYTEDSTTFKEVKEFIKDENLDPTYKTQLLSKVKTGNSTLTLSDALQNKLKDQEKDYKVALDKYRQAKSNTKIPQDKKDLVIRRALILYRDNKKAYTKTARLLKIQEN